MRQWVSEGAVRAAMPAVKPCAPIEACTAQYLAETAATVIPFYEMQKAGGLAGLNPAGEPFVVARIAAASAQLRDMVASAWEASAGGSIGYPALTVDQVVTERIDPWNALYGDD
ncbi:MAG TPA: hypothetical protein VGI79_23130 [Caulobacteraceae bacterium]